MYTVEDADNVAHQYMLTKCRQNDLLYVTHPTPPPHGTKQHRQPPLRPVRKNALKNTYFFPLFIRRQK